MHAIRDNEFIGRRLRQLRERAGLSQNAVGDLLEVSYQQIQKYERGVNRISVEKLQRLAAALRVPIMTFFDDPSLPPSLQEQTAEGTALYQPTPLSSRERDLLQWFRTIQDEELRVCLVTLMQLAAQMQRQR